MNKLSGVSLFIAVVACSGVAFSVVELRKMSSLVASLEDKVTKLESAPAGGATGANPGASSPATMAEVSKQIESLKSELSQVKSGQDAILASSKNPPTPDGGSSTSSAKPLPRTDADLQAAVEAVLAKKDADKKAAEEKQRTDMASRMAQGMVDYLAKELGLTDQQKTQISDIIATQTTAFRDLWSNRKEGEDVRTKMADMKTDTDQKIKAILTPEQGVKYDEVSKGGQLFGFGGSGGRRRSGGGDNGN